MTTDAIGTGYRELRGTSDASSLRNQLVNRFQLETVWSPNLRNAATPARQPLARHYATFGSHRVI